MKFDPIIIDKYLNDKATPEEQELAYKLLRTTEGQKYIASCFDHDASIADAEEVKKWLDHPIPTRLIKRRLIRSTTKRHYFLQLSKIAAIVLPFIFVLGVALFLANHIGIFSKVEYASIEAPKGSLIQLVLQDGTSILLNSDSKIRYPKKFGLFKREIELWGEAYFSVSKDKNRPFIVDLKDIKIKVIGTQFNVKSYPSDSLVEVLLDEGAILLEDNNNNKQSLQPGKYVSYNRNSKKYKTNQTYNRNTITGWRTSDLRFYCAQLGDILKTLERQYDVTFDVIDPSLNNVHFTFSSSKQLVKDILKDLETVSYIRFIYQNKTNSFKVINIKKP